jgi:hypothetical protein
MTNEELNTLALKAKSTEIAKVSDLIEMLTPFKDYYLEDANCSYCGGHVRVVESKEHAYRLKRQNDLISIVDQNGMGEELSEYLENNK